MRLGVLCGESAPLFQRLSADSAFLLCLRSVDDTRGRALPSPDAGADDACLPVGTFVEDACFDGVHVGLLRGCPRGSQGFSADVHSQLFDIFDL